MDNEGPYREGPQWRVCPRCDEILEENFPGGMMCPRCAGSWISQVVLDAAFGDPTWPNGSTMWWRRELHCPECTSSGTKSVMDAIEARGVIVDRCAGHGMWFDDGELERVTDTTTDPMALLRERVARSRPEIDAARASYDRRRDQVRAERAALREEVERAERLAAAQELEALRARQALVAQQAASVSLDTRQARLDAQRHELVQAIAGHEAELLALRRQVVRIESDLVRLRERLGAL